MLIAKQMRVMPTGRDVKQQFKRGARDRAKLVMLPIHRDLGFEPRHVAHRLCRLYRRDALGRSFAIMFSLRANAISPRSALSQFRCAAGVIDSNSFSI